jgi:hypothetical protein
MKKLTFLLFLFIAVKGLTQVKQDSLSREALKQEIKQEILQEMQLNGSQPKKRRESGYGNRR